MVLFLSKNGTIDSKRVFLKMFTGQGGALSRHLISTFAIHIQSRHLISTFAIHIQFPPCLTRPGLADVVATTTTTSVRQCWVTGTIELSPDGHYILYYRMPYSSRMAILVRFGSMISWGDDLYLLIYTFKSNYTHFSQA